MDGNKRTGSPPRFGLYRSVDLTSRLAAFFLANEYLRGMGIPGLADGCDVGSATDVAQRHMDVAEGKLELEASRIYRVGCGICVCDNME